MDTVLYIFYLSITKLHVKLNPNCVGYRKMDTWPT
jgi:hypothetical protein